MKGVLFNLFLIFCVFLFGCEKGTDGPIEIEDGSEGYEGNGFFLSASLDSGAAIHLVDDTLFLTMGNIWSYSNCALKEIRLPISREDSTLWLSPEIKIKSDGRDCAAPFYRPDTVLKVVLKSLIPTEVSWLKVRNDADSTLDSIRVRRGNFQTDSFDIYMDSSFADAYHYPIRTNSKKGSTEIPTILRVLDSLTPRVFYWRTMESKCSHRVDLCNKVVADTLYPSSWNLNDTNLVPIHYACADSDSVYCINSKWVNDSTDLGKVQQRPDTIFHYSTYYMEKIPSCGTYNSFYFRNYGVGQKVHFVRELLKPFSEETHCGPSSREDWMIYNMSTSRLVVDTDTTFIVDSLFSWWNQAVVAPESLVVKE